jgi:glycosyltransferase involved in cell wall biosynthesis
MDRRLVVLESHPVQYHAPVYRCVQQRFGVPVTAIYGSDVGATGYRDREFGIRLAWDTDLLSGYDVRFLGRAAAGGGRAADADAVAARGLGRALAEIAPAAVLLCGYGARFDRAAWIHALRRRLPVLFRAETTDHAVGRPRVKAWVRSHALRLLYARCARLLYVGERSYRHYRRLGCPENRLVFSPYCVDPTPFRTGEADRAALRLAARRELAIADGRIVVLFAGKLVSRKGPDLLVEAARRWALPDGQRPVVVFLGDGEERARLATLAGAEPAVDVRFVGFRNQRALSAYYHASDLLALPSRRSETWGLVVNEALLHGVPCVVSEGVGCAPDLLRPGITGEVCRADSVEDLRAALVRATALTSRPDVRAECRAAVVGYGVEQAAAGIASAFQALAGADGLVRVRA